MKKYLLFLCLMGLIICISACSAEEAQENTIITLGKSSDEMVGENYQKIISELEELGFTNIKTKIMDDLITGWLTKDGEIEQVEINGATEFSAHDSFQKSSKIIITYHTFPIKEKNDTESANVNTSETADQTTNNKSE